MRVEYSAGANRRAAWLALGFGATVAIWAIGYILRLPFINAPGWLVGALMLACLLGGGVLAGRFGARGLVSGVYAGLVSALLNLMFLGSLMSSMRLSGLMLGLAVLLCIAFGCSVGLVGALIGRAQKTSATQPDWTPVFAWVTVAAVLLLVVSGGLATSFSAGLSVAGWPGSDGYFVFFYPLSRMTGDVYFAQAHRLLGALAGLAVLCFALHLAFAEPRRWLKWLAWCAFALVAVQCVLGGLSVTGRFTLSAQRAAMAPDLALAIAHGVLAQALYALVVVLAVATTRGWRMRRTAPAVAGIEGEFQLLLWLVPLVVVQIFLGALLRHFHWGLHLHLTLAVILLIFGLITGVRAWSMFEGEAAYSRAGLGLLFHLGAQLVLGFAAWAAITAAGDTTPVYVGVIATLHQTTGALVLSAVVKLGLWSRSLAGWV
jgi:heme a synthase